MIDAAAVDIATIFGGSLSDDGDALLLVTTTSTSAEVVLSIPKSQLSELLAITAAARTETRRRQGLPANETEEMLVVNHFALGRDSTTRVPVLMLTLPNGGRLTFKLSEDILTAMHATMQSMQAGAVPLVRPTGPLN